MIAVKLTTFRSSLGAVGFIATLAIPQFAAAADFAMQLGIDVGGETLATAVYTDGEESDVKAGQLFHLAAGLVHPIGDQLEFQGTVGWKFDSASARNGEISFDRYPIEALLFARSDRFRFGGGPTIHLNPTLDSDGAASSLGTVEFDNAVGFVAQIDMFVQRTLNLGLRTTFISYDTSVGGVSVEGNSIGLVFGGRIE